MVRHVLGPNIFSGETAVGFISSLTNEISKLTKVIAFYLSYFDSDLLTDAKGDQKRTLFGDRRG